MTLTVEDYNTYKSKNKEVASFIFDKLLEDLPDSEKEKVTDIYKAVEDYEVAGDIHDKAIKNCNHPLAFRTHYNGGNSGSYYDRGSYWTSHVCHVCHKRWSTSQSWQNIGDGTGLPNSSQEDDE